MAKGFSNIQLIGVLIVLFGLFLFVGSTGVLGSVYTPGFEESFNGVGLTNFLSVDDGSFTRNLALAYANLNNKEYGPGVPVSIDFRYDVRSEPSNCHVGYSLNNACLDGVNNSAVVSLYVNNNKAESFTVSTTGLQKFDAFSSLRHSCNSENQNVQPEERLANDYCRNHEFNISNSDLVSLAGRDWGFLDLKYTQKIITDDEVPDNVTINGDEVETPFELRQRIFKQSDLCNPQSGFVIQQDFFNAGDVISINSLSSPFKAFCWGSSKQPVYYSDFIDSSDNIVGSTNEPYVFMQDGGSYTVPAGNAIIIKYISEPTTGTFACDPDLTNVNGECVPLPGFQFSCNEGVYDPVTLSCLNQPIHACPGSYNTETNTCTIIVSGENAGTVVPEGSSLTELSSGQLLYSFSPGDFCSDGSVPFTTDGGESVCSDFSVSIFDSSPLKPFTENPFYSVLLVLLGLSLFVLGKKK